MKQAVLFDVDGTLVDSNDLHAAAWQEAFRDFGVELPFEMIRAQIGKGGDNLLPTLLPPELVEEKQQEMEDHRSSLFRRDYLDRARPFSGVCELLRLLHEDGKKVVLATSAKQPELDFHLERIGCRGFIDATTSRSDVEKSKPCPDIFEAALAKVAPLGPEEALVVGDSTWDIEAAAKVGLTAIALRCGGFPEEDLRRAGAAAVYDDPQELIDRYPEWLRA